MVDSSHEGVNATAFEILTYWCRRQVNNTLAYANLVRALQEGGMSSLYDVLEGPKRMYSRLVNKVVTIRTCVR